MVIKLLTRRAFIENFQTHRTLIIRILNNKHLRYKGIGDNFLHFWFRFIYPNQALIEMEKFDLLKRYITNNYEQYSELLLEKYFRQKFAEEEIITTIGNFWDNNGENEIDIIALNDFDKTAIVAEVKRNPKKISLQTLAMKTTAIQKQLAKYKISLVALSLNEV
jgi:AAA+ ATPase superfamily predicted ATPase